MKTVLPIIFFIIHVLFFISFALDCFRSKDEAVQDRGTSRSESQTSQTLSQRKKPATHSTDNKQEDGGRKTLYHHVR